MKTTISITECDEDGLTIKVYSDEDTNITYVLGVLERAKLTMYQAMDSDIEIETDIDGPDEEDNADE